MALNGIICAEVSLRESTHSLTAELTAVKTAEPAASTVKVIDSTRDNSASLLRWAIKLGYASQSPDSSSRR